MPDPSEIARILATNRYMVLGTADPDGRPWVTPVYFAPNGDDTFYWVSSPDSRHSRNLATRPSIAITVFDSTVAIGSARAAYFDAESARATAGEFSVALESLNSRLPENKTLERHDLAPNGPMVLYRADLRHRYLLVRGGDKEHGNALDMTLEV